jgi:hypothetical protein
MRFLVRSRSDSLGCSEGASRPYRRRFRRGCDQVLHRRRRLAGPLTGEADQVAKQRILLPVSLAVFLLDADRKAGVLPRRGLSRLAALREIHLFQQRARSRSGSARYTPSHSGDGASSNRIPENCRNRTGGRRRQSWSTTRCPSSGRRRARRQGEIRDDAMPFGVLRHFIGNRHIQTAGQRPPGLSVGGAHEAPIVGRRRWGRL